MIKYVKGNIFDSEAEVLVNPVNTVGVMGAGLAKQFKERFPRMYAAYRALCNFNTLTVGKIMWWRPTDGVTIANFPTKMHWRNPSKLEWISEGLLSLHNDMVDMSYKSVAMPKIGCGLGGLKWDAVRTLIEYEFEDDPDITVEVYV